MRYELRLTAYDMLDLVHIAVVVTGPDLPGSITSEVVLSSTTTVRGTGESDPYQWTRDALVAALEAL